MLSRSLRHVLESLSTCYQDLVDILSRFFVTCCRDIFNMLSLSFRSAVEIPFEMQSRCLSRFLSRRNRGVCPDSFRDATEVFVETLFEMQSRCLSRFISRCNRGVCRDFFWDAIEVFVKIHFEMQSRYFWDHSWNAIEMFVEIPLETHSRGQVLWARHVNSKFWAPFPLPIFALLRVAINVSLPTLRWYWSAVSEEETWIARTWSRSVLSLRCFELTTYDPMSHHWKRTEGRRAHPKDGIGKKKFHRLSCR